MVGAEWVLYFLLLLSIVSITLIVERFRFYREANQGLEAFRTQLRGAAASGNMTEAMRIARERAEKQKDQSPDLESGLAAALLNHTRGGVEKSSADVLGEVAQDSVLRTRLLWDRNLAILATIGSNAPFVGLFGTVLGIIKAFHDLSQQAATGVQGVSSGISEALIATAVGILVAIPAVVAFNLFQRKVRSALTEAEALKSFLIGKMSS